MSQPTASISSGHFRRVFLSITGKAVPLTVCKITMVSAEPNGKIWAKSRLLSGLAVLAAGQSSEKAREQSRARGQDARVCTAFRERQQNLLLHFQSDSVVWAKVFWYSIPSPKHHLRTACVHSHQTPGWAFSMAVFGALRRGAVRAQPSRDGGPQAALSPRCC